MHKKVYNQEYVVYIVDLVMLSSEQAKTMGS